MASFWLPGYHEYMENSLLVKYESYRDTLAELNCKSTCALLPGKALAMERSLGDLYRVSNAEAGANAALQSSHWG